MTPRQSRARRRIALVGATLVAVNALAFAGFSWPRLNRVRKAEERALEVAARKKTLETLWQRVLSRKELLAQNRRDMESLSRDDLKPREMDLFATQREIERLARASGLRSLTSSYAIEPIKATGLVKCEITLPLDGSYQSLTSFLSGIERNARFIVVDQMALAQGQGGARMSLKLSAIFKDEGSRASR